MKPINFYISEIFKKDEDELLDISVICAEILQMHYDLIHFSALIIKEYAKSVINNKNKNFVKGIERALNEKFKINIEILDCD